MTTDQLESVASEGSTADTLVFDVFAALLADHPGPVRWSITPDGYLMQMGNLPTQTIIISADRKFSPSRESLITFIFSATKVGAL